MATDREIEMTKHVLTLLKYNTNYLSDYSKDIKSIKVDISDVFVVSSDDDEYYDVSESDREIHILYGNVKRCLIPTMIFSRKMEVKWQKALDT